MPKVIGYTPPWLSRPSPGARIFSDPSPQSPASPPKRMSYLASPQATEYQGPQRLLASRGTEILAVVGNKIRWADLALVKEAWEDKARAESKRFTLQKFEDPEEGEENAAYRTLDASVYYKIRQISVSPSGTFLAISTEHTVHIAILPAPSRLTEQDRSPIKLKTYQLGPTIHVIPESPLASVLWHPLASSTSSTDCIVTVTTEAAVRVWELDRSNKWSFERPALAIDLKKLVDGSSADQDFEPSGFGKSRGFSVDVFDMEVSAACFGGRGKDDEDAWASMTLWTAMRNGDIYALCPLLPSKWRPTATTIPSLTTTAVANLASLPDDADSDERRAADQQYEWVREIDNDDPQLVESTDTFTEYEIRVRPQNPSAIPRLQGPFTIQAEDDLEDIEVSDIIVFPSKHDEQDLYSGEDDDFGDFQSLGVPFTTICLATPGNDLWIAIDLDGISGQWLPKRGRSTFSMPSADTIELTLIDSFLLSEQGVDSPTNWPVFTLDHVNNHSFFMTTSKEVHSLSLNDWIVQLAAELNGTGPVDRGLKTRLETSCQGPVCLVSQLLEAGDQPNETFGAPAVIDDGQLGYLLLTSTPTSAHTVFFDQVHLQTSTGPPSPELTIASPSRQSSQLSKMVESEQLESIPTRAPYAPATLFYQNHIQPIEAVRQRLAPPLKRAVAEKPMRLSPAMLEVMTATHRTIGSRTSELEAAAAELFRRCQRLREELGDQVQQMAELANRLQQLRGAGDDESPKKSHDERIKEANERQKKLNARYEALRRNVGKIRGKSRELTSKEVAWIDEIETLARNVGVASDGADDEKEVALEQRFETVKSLAASLVAAAKKLEVQSKEADLAASNASLGTSGSGSPSASMYGSRMSGSGIGLGVNPRYQKEKIADVMAMVEREGAVIEAVLGRLERLKLEY